ncbi:MAG: helix-turn-helix domain containing protein [Gammaproteobacteria bacterium]
MARRAPAQKRATTDIDKLHRRQDILVAAEAQLRQVAFENFSMEVLARDLGLARGTLYRYFETRETLLLGLYQQQRTSWCAAMLADVQPGLGDAAFVSSSTTFRPRSWSTPSVPCSRSSTAWWRTWPAV